MALNFEKKPIASDSASVIDAIRKAPGGIPKRDIFPQVELSWGGLCLVIKRALKKGYIVSGKSQSNMPGRPCIPLMIVPDAMYLLGVDIGSCTTKIVLCDFELKIVHSMVVPTEFYSSNERFIQWLCELIRTSIPAGLEKKVHAVGFAISGNVDFYNNKIISGGNFGIPHGADISIDQVAEKVSIPCCTLNTQTAAVCAEYHFGQFSGTADITNISLGVGIGAGIISGHQLLFSQGRHLVGQIGHMLVPDNPYRCKCTNCSFIGCLEAFSGGISLCRIAKERGIAGENISTRELDKMASAGNEDARKLMIQAAKYNAIGIASIIQMYSPEIVTLSGGQCKKDGFLYRHTLKELLNMIPVERHNFKIILSSLGEYQAALGAARIAYECFLDI